MWQQYGAYTWTLFSGVLPTGISLDRFTGTINGQTANTGSYPLSITVQDSAGRTAKKSFTLKTSAPLAIKTTAIAAGYLGALYSENILTTGGIPPISYSYLGVLPAGLSLGVSSGKISGTPSAAGLNNISITVTDSSYPTPVTVSQTLPLRIWSALNIATTSIPSGTQKAVYSTTLSGNGGAAPYSWSLGLGTLPQGINIDGTTGIIAGTPATCGSFPFNARLTDSATISKSVDKALTVTVACSNDYIISGNAGIAGATVTYSGTASGNVTADGSGNFSIGPLLSGTYTVTPTKASYFFTPASRAVTVNKLDASMEAFVGAQDTTAPTLTPSTLAEGARTNNATLNISGTAKDTDSGIKSLTINGQLVEVKVDGTFTVAITLAAGANTITTIATDNANNQTTDTRTITLDTTAPTLSVSAPADNSKTAQSLATITGTIDETSTVTVRLNNDSPQNASITENGYSADVTFASGLNTITVTATDLAGNITSVVRSVTYDNTKPSLSVSNPAQDISTTQTSITISGTVTDIVTNATISITADGQLFTPTVATDGSFSQSINLPTDKTYAVVVTATDQAGNTTTSQRNIIKTATAATGDVTGDGKVDIADALKALRISIGLDAATPALLLLADVAPLAGGKPAPDGVIDIADALVILEKAVGLFTW